MELHLCPQHCDPHSVLVPGLLAVSNNLASKYSDEFVTRQITYLCTELTQLTEQALELGQKEKEKKETLSFAKHFLCSWV